ncbi:unnamed protein product [Arctia plantaginis]|uniref:Uncharacterized protein n=1 Tax=Arctia plantaginis TaxID=874455 RepID=A0A8S1BLL4_ARCPL|nr:unnamed protein product [Arctia plantaginis]
MRFLLVWKLTRPPNYKTNIGKGYPYSEVPFIGEYNLIKLPSSLSELIDHVDYWGKGKNITSHGRSGSKIVKTAITPSNSWNHLPTGRFPYQLRYRHIAFLNVTMLKDRLYKLVIDGEFDRAEALSSKLDKDGARDVLTATVQKLLESNSGANTNMMFFAYKL